MSPRSFYRLFFITVVAVAAAAALWIVTPSYAPDKAFGQKFIPGLLEKINDVAVMSIEHAGETTTFVRDAEGRWTLMEAANYPADKERIRNSLIGLANLEKIEPKTALAEYYPDIGVEDNAGKQSRSYLVTLLDSEGRKILGLLIGKSTRGIQWNGQGYFVRSPGEAQSWLVRGAVDVTGGAKSWLNTRLFPLSESDIAGITFIDQTNTREVSYRRPSAFSKLTPVFGSDNYFMKSDNFIDGMLKAFTSMDFTDVGVRPQNMGKMDPHTSVFIETAQGMNVYFFLYLIDKKPYVAVSFRAEESASEDVKKQAEQLEARHSPWLYQVHGSKIAAILPFLPKPAGEAKPEGKKTSPPVPQSSKSGKKDATP